AAPAVPEPPDPPGDRGTGVVPPAATAAAAAAVAAVPTTIAVRRAGRERVTPGGAADAAYGGSTVGAAAAPAPEIRVDAEELARMATIEFAPPAGLTPAQGGVVLRERVFPEHKVAWLIQAAIDGVVDLDDSTGKTVLRRVAGAPAPPEHQHIFATMFAKGPEIRLGTYSKDFAKAWQQVTDALASWRDASGLWDRQADVRKTVVRGLGLLAGLVGAGLAFLGGFLAGTWGAPWLVVTVLAGLVAGAGLAALVGAWELHVRTPPGPALWLRTEALRRFRPEPQAAPAGACCGSTRRGPWRSGRSTAGPGPWRPRASRPTRPASATPTWGRRSSPPRRRRPPRPRRAVAAVVAAASGAARSAAAPAAGA